MLYGYMVAFLGSLATCASMAEMASMFVLASFHEIYLTLMLKSGILSLAGNTTGLL